MDRELVIGDQTIVFDHEATIDLYRKAILVAGSDTCDCIPCKNFAAQKENVFPVEFLGLLERLGIDWTREWETFEYDWAESTTSEPVLYGGWFLFVGKLVSGSETRPKLRDGFAFWAATSFPTGTLASAAPLCAIEFLARIPWVLTRY
jgi:hypothetical protein